MLKKTSVKKIAIAVIKKVTMSTNVLTSSQKTSVTLDNLFIDD